MLQEGEGREKPSKGGERVVHRGSLLALLIAGTVVGDAEDAVQPNHHLEAAADRDGQRRRVGPGAARPLQHGDNIDPRKKRHKKRMAGTKFDQNIIEEINKN